MFNQVLFAVFPYAAIVLAVVVGIYRYQSDRFSYSSFSSQFLEKRQLFWGSVAWHYGILIVLLAHLLAALFPRFWATVISTPVRLYVLEVTGHALAVMTIIGLAVLIVRRMRNARISIVTSPMDWVLLVLLLGQVVLGLWVALFFRWGADWYLHTAVPWLASLVMLDPQIQFVTALPFVVKFHMLGGFILIAIFPFTRLVHLVTFPIAYLWRPVQVVIWNLNPKHRR